MESDIAVYYSSCGVSNTPEGSVPERRSKPSRGTHHCWQAPNAATQCHPQQRVSRTGPQGQYRNDVKLSADLVGNEAR